MKRQARPQMNEVYGLLYRDIRITALLAELNQIHIITMYYNVV